MCFRSNAWAFGTTALVLTLAACGEPSSGADDTAAGAEQPPTTTSDRECNDTSLPKRQEQQPSLTSDQSASLETVQHWVDLVASAEPDQIDPALFADVRVVFPNWDVDSAERLSAEWGNVEAVHLSWVREDDDTFVIGGLVYDNASTTPCRTGFLCWRADVEEGIIDSLTQANVDGTITEDERVSSDYPYIDERWIPAAEEISPGITVQSRLIELCDVAIPRQNNPTPTASGFIEGTAVATSSGGSEACQAQPDGPLPAGLVEGASVTIRDALSEEVIGTGTVTSTDFVPLTEDTEGGIPPWTCTFNIGATLLTTSDSITVQVGELRPFGPVSLDESGRFNVSVFGLPGTETTVPFTESTVVPVDSADRTRPSGEPTVPVDSLAPAETSATT